MPVEYSPAVTRTPSTPSASCAKFVPKREMSSAVEFASSDLKCPDP
jgi:hypothetical protein